jgi:glycerophosphoryl diester phosphodiesterase
MPATPPIIVAHRGLHGALPENSLAAMTAAWDAGILWCECDVQVSSDGVPIVIHDETLDRTTTGRGRAADLRLDQLDDLRLRDAEGNPTSHRIPTLEKLLALAGPTRRLLVETKQPMGEKIHEIARLVHRKNGMLHSFHREDMLCASRATDGACPIALLADDFHELPSDFPGAVHIRHESFRPQDVHKNVGVWTVNELGHMERLLGSNITMLITDFPLEAMRILGSRLP